MFIFCDRSFPRCDIGWVQVNSATMINPENGRVFNRPNDMAYADEKTLTPAELAVYFQQNAPTDFLDEDFFAQLFSKTQVVDQPGRLLWFHVDYMKFLEPERAPVQPALDRLTTYLRHRLAVRHARETFLFPELAMATPWRAGEASPFRQLNPDLFKHILDLAA